MPHTGKHNVLPTTLVVNKARIAANRCFTRCRQQKFRTNPGIPDIDRSWRRIR